MKARIPPPVVFLICGLSMFLIHRLTPSSDVDFLYRTSLFLVVLLAGLCVLVLGAANILKRKTTIHPDRKSLSHPTSLVANGIFGYSRNPVYLGMATMLVAWIIFLANWLTVLGVIVFLAFITQYQIKPEEEALGKIFGEDYARSK
jgi:protein-S-isoprenylcysteine O-methyltransferase Ste14